MSDQISEEDKEKDTDHKHVKNKPNPLKAKPGGTKFGTRKIECANVGEDLEDIF